MGCWDDGGYSAALFGCWRFHPTAVYGGRGFYVGRWTGAAAQIRARGTQIRARDLRRAFLVGRVVGGLTSAPVSLATYAPGGLGSANSAGDDYSPYCDTGHTLNKINALFNVLVFMPGKWGEMGGIDDYRALYCWILNICHGLPWYQVMAVSNMPY